MWVSPVSFRRFSQMTTICQRKTLLYKQLNKIIKNTFLQTNPNLIYGVRRENATTDKNSSLVVIKIPFLRQKSVISPVRKKFWREKHIKIVFPFPNCVTTFPDRIILLPWRGSLSLSAWVCCEHGHMPGFCWVGVCCLLSWWRRHRQKTTTQYKPETQPARQWHPGKEVAP